MQTRWSETNRSVKQVQSITLAMWLQLEKEGLTCGTRSEPDPDVTLDRGAAPPQQDGGSPGRCSATDRSGTQRDRHDASLAASSGRRYSSAKSRCIYTTRRKRNHNTTAVTAVGRVMLFSLIPCAQGDDHWWRHAEGRVVVFFLGWSQPEADGTEVLCCHLAVRMYSAAKSCSYPSFIMWQTWMEFIGEPPHRRENVNNMTN